MCVCKNAEEDSCNAHIRFSTAVSVWKRSTCVKADVWDQLKCVH